MNKNPEEHRGTNTGADDGDQQPPKQGDSDKRRRVAEKDVHLLHNHGLWGPDPYPDEVAPR